jgi:hypothetical protein
MNETASQLTLPLAGPVATEVIVRQPNFLAMMEFSVRVAGLEMKEIYLDLGIDKSHWTKIMNASAGFPVTKLERFMDVCGNKFPLVWLAWRRGKGIHPLESEHQRVVREKDERIARLEIKNEALTEALRGRPS